MHDLELDLPSFAKPTRLALTGSLSSPSIDLQYIYLVKNLVSKGFQLLKF